ncbi:MAG: YqeG family HAD IIIA-type phosphatase [Coriobacteriia bacterium]|nr:YqeG family HAD IIIA-type phosphatase [Coriobacteriia bacterium]
MELLTPDLQLDKVEDITLELLESLGITALLVDIDNTLVSRATSKIEDSVLAWVKSMKEAGIACCLLSNNWHGVIHDYAAELGVPVVGKAMKPLPLAFIKALNLIGAKRATTAMVGDQVFTDILGARFCVMFSILVKPLSTTDLWYTKIFRRVEQKLGS